jgi:hypothetical protein
MRSMAVWMGAVMMVGERRETEAEGPHLHDGDPRTRSLVSYESFNKAVRAGTHTSNHRRAS